MECYNEDENRKVTIAAAEVEYENYCKHTRVEEIMAEHYIFQSDWLYPL